MGGRVLVCWWRGLDKVGEGPRLGWGRSLYKVEGAFIWWGRSLYKVGEEPRLCGGGAYIKVGGRT